MDQDESVEGTIAGHCCESEQEGDPSGLVPLVRVYTFILISHFIEFNTRLQKTGEKCNRSIC